MGGVSQEGTVPPATAAAAEQVFRALVDGCLHDMAAGATEVCIVTCPHTSVTMTCPV